MAEPRFPNDIAREALNNLDRALSGLPKDNALQGEVNKTKELADKLKSKLGEKTT